MAVIATPDLSSNAPRWHRRCALAAALLALAMSMMVLAFSSPASAAGCSGTSKLLNASDVQISWSCDYQTPEFWIVGSKAPVDYLELGYVSGFTGFECRVNDERDMHEAIEEGSAMRPILGCGPPARRKPTGPGLETEEGESEGEGEAETSSGEVWTSKSSGVVRTPEPACTGPSPLHLQVWTIEGPPGEWDPSAGFEMSWMRRLSLPEPCGDSQGSVWAYAPPAQAASKTGAIKALFRCTVDCTIRAQGTIRVPGKAATASRASAIRLRPLSKSLAANQTSPFKWTLSKSQRARLREHRSTAKITATSVDASGTKVTVVQKLTVR